jgi:hypothetical protein
MHWRDSLARERVATDVEESEARPPRSRFEDELLEESEKDEKDGLESARPKLLGVGFGGGVGCIDVV